MTSVGESWAGVKADPEQNGRLHLYKKPGPQKVTFLVGELAGGGGDPTPQKSCCS